jgi:two-component system response regulator
MIYSKNGVIIRTVDSFIKEGRILTEKKILLVEDDPDHAELIVDVLEPGDVKNKVIVMGDGQEVINYLQKVDNEGIDNEIKVQISLVILDLNIPKVDGMNVLRFIKENSRYSSINVIILSTSSDDETIAEAYKNGADGFITKPASHSEFVKQVQTLREFCNAPNPNK